MNRFSIAGLLAAGAMLFATLGCDTAVSEKEWAPEIPTTYAKLDGTNSSDVTAVWDFSTLSTTSAGQWDGVISTSESTIKKGTEIKPSSGSKAALYAGTFKGKTNAGVLQSSKGTASLSDLSNAYSLVLNLEADSDVVIKAKGAGAAEAARLIAIYAADIDEDEKTATATGDALVYKNNLASTKDVWFQLKDAPAGAYMIYINGSSIYSIDTTATTSKPAQITALKITTAQSDIASFEAYETLTLDVVDSADASYSLAKDAVWTTSDKSVATVKEGVVTGVAAGTAVIRARIGRFYDERTVTVTKSTKTRATFFAADKMPSAATAWADASDDLKKDVLTPTVVGNFATISEATLDIATIEGNTWSDAPTLAKKDSATNSYKMGFYWKDGLSSGTSYDTTVATLKFKVTPKSGTIKLDTLSAQAYTGKGNGAAKIKLTAGSETGTVSVTKADSVDSVDLGGIAISGETQVTIEIQIANGKNGVSCGIQDLALSITE